MPNGQEEFRHRLIQQEMRTQLTSREYPVPIETDGVIVLSATPWMDKDGKPIEDSPEARARVGFAIEVVKRIAAKKSGKKFENVSTDDILTHGPHLFLNAATEQLPVYETITKELGFPETKIELVDCGGEAIANTKTEFEVINEDPRFKHAKHLTFITSDYHVPRVQRTGMVNLNPAIHFTVIPVPHDRFPYSVIKNVLGEVRRIERYAKKGDIRREITSPMMIYGNDAPKDVKKQIIQAYQRIFPPYVYEGKDKNEWLEPNSNHPVRFVIFGPDGKTIIAHAAIISRMVEQAGHTYRVAGLGGVFTHEHYRALGYGKQIVEKATQYVVDKKNQHDLGMLFCREPLVAYYQSLGWEVIPSSHILVGSKREKAKPLAANEVTMVRFVSKYAHANKEILTTQPLFVGEEW